MKKNRFTGEQIAFALKQAETGTSLSALKPQVSFLTIKDSFTLELDSTIAPTTIKNF